MISLISRCYLFVLCFTSLWVIVNVVFFLVIIRFGMIVFSLFGFVFYFLFVGSKNELLLLSGSILI